jgi:hypothetical protein
MMDHSILYWKNVNKNIEPTFFQKILNLNIFSTKLNKKISNILNLNFLKKVEPNFLMFSTFLKIQHLIKQSPPPHLLLRLRRPRRAVGHGCDGGGGWPTAVA